MKINANAKINLSLDITGKRPDGYHNICMIMQETNLCDSLEVNLTKEPIIDFWCDKKVVDKDEDNIAYKAAALFLKKTRAMHGCSIKLKKCIPDSAGLGGGSADAAAVLRALNELCGNPFEKKELIELGLSLGADVPFCIMGGTAIAEGIGEFLTPLSGIEKKWIALIKPDFSVSTAEAYRMIDSFDLPHPDVNKAAKYIKQGDMESLYRVCANVFEYAIAKNHPQIKFLKEYFMSHGARFAMMSGSGPTVYGIYDSFHAAKAAIDALNEPSYEARVAQFSCRNK